MLLLQQGLGARASEGDQGLNRGYSTTTVQLESGQHTFHEYRFNPALQKVKLVHAAEGATLGDFVAQSGAEAGINGGFWNDVYSRNL